MSTLIPVSSLSKLVREGKGIVVIGFEVIRGAYRFGYSMVLKARYSYYGVIPRLGVGKATRL